MISCCYSIYPTSTQMKSIETNDLADTIMTDFINSIKSSDGITIEFIGIDKVRSDIMELIPMSIRTNPKCKCNDIFCLHKQLIHPFLYIAISDRLKSLVRIRKFYPSAFDCKPFKRHIIDQRDDFYLRYTDEVVLNETYEINRYFDVFENIIFEDDGMNGENVILSLGGNQQLFKINNNRLFNDGSYMPVYMFVYTQIILKFTKDNIKCKFIVGNLRSRSFELFSDDHEYWLNNEICVKCRDNMGYFKDTDNLRKSR